MKGGVYMILPNNPIYVEVWRSIPYEIFPNVKQHYLISTFGRIYNCETNTCLPQNIYYDKDKYITISLSTIDGSKQYEQIHRLVLLTFSPISDYKNYDVNHKDGIKYHNWIWNLEWSTKSQNIQHAIKNNLFNLGETRDNSIITNEQAHDICRLIEKGLSSKEIEEIYPIENCDVSAIARNIKGGYSWKHISSLYDFSNSYKHNRFSEADVHKICKYFEDNGRDSSTKEVLNFIGINLDSYNDKERNVIKSSISAIRNKKTFKNICNNYNY